jgi:hypothetical protein
MTDFFGGNGIPHFPFLSVLLFIQVCMILSLSFRREE